MPYDQPGFVPVRAAGARARTSPARIQDARSPCVIAPRIAQSPPPVGAASERYATPRGTRPSAVNRSCGRSNDVLVSRLNCPVNGTSVKSAVANRAGAPTARPRPASESPKSES